MPAGRPGFPPPPAGPGEDPLPPGAVIPDLPQSPPPSGTVPRSPATRLPAEPQDAAGKTDQSGAPTASAGNAPERQTDPRAAAARSAETRPDAGQSFADRLAERLPGAARGAGGGLLEGETEDVPWEQPERYGYVIGLYQTILRVLFDLPRFFTALGSASAPWYRPVAFYILLGIVQTLFGQIWFAFGFQAFGPSITDPQAQALFGALAQESNLPLTLILAPGTLAIQLLVYTSLFYLMLRLVHPEGVTFIRVLRVICYSAAPAVFCLVPLVGHLINPVWFAVCCFVGCKYALRLTWTQASLAIAPLYLVVFAVVLQALRQLAALS